jgi:hypothetical protein
VIHNAPFPEAAIASRIPVPGFIGPASFAAAGGPELLAYDRLVLAFNAPGINPTTMCTTPVVAGGPPGSRIDLLVVLCRGTYATSFAALGAPSAGSPDDPSFRQLLAQMTAVVFPPRRVDGGGCDRPGC